MDFKSQLSIDNIITQRIDLIERLIHGKKLTVGIWGYGITGKSLLKWCLKYLSSDNRYIIIDKKKIEENIERVDFILEAELSICEEKFDIVLPSPGIVLDRSSNIYKKIVPELDLFYYFWNTFLFDSIVITGSIGKTSTTTLIHYYLEKYFTVILCGNIGYPMMDFIDLNSLHQKKSNIIAIIEASNMQLEHTVLVRPTYFIITNLYPNHLNSHNSYELYIQAKLSPVIYNFNHIKKFIVDSTAYREICAFYPSFFHFYSDKTIFIDTFEQKNIPSYSFPNNWKTVAIILSFFNKYEENFYSFFELPMLPHFRLEKIYDKEDIFIYNDSKSTIIEATISAINTIIKQHNNSLIYTIIGGLSKGVCRLNGIFNVYDKSYKLLLFGKEAQDLNDNYERAFGNRLTIYNDLEDTIKYIYEDVIVQRTNNPKVNIVVLFSPGGASFDLFESYIDRGNKFNALIQKIFIQKK